MERTEAGSAAPKKRTFAKSLLRGIGIAVACVAGVAALPCLAFFSILLSLYPPYVFRPVTTTKEIAASLRNNRSDYETIVEFIAEYPMPEQPREYDDGGYLRRSYPAFLQFSQRNGEVAYYAELRNYDGEDAVVTDVKTDAALTARLLKGRIRQIAQSSTVGVVTFACDDGFDGTHGLLYTPSGEVSSFRPDARRFTSERLDSHWFYFEVGTTELAPDEVIAIFSAEREAFETVAKRLASFDYSAYRPWKSGRLPFLLISDGWMEGDAFFYSMYVYDSLRENPAHIPEKPIEEALQTLFCSVGCGAIYTTEHCHQSVQFFIDDYGLADGRHAIVYTTDGKEPHDFAIGEASLTQRIDEHWFYVKTRPRHRDQRETIDDLKPSE